MFVRGRFGAGGAGGGGGWAELGGQDETAELFAPGYFRHGNEDEARTPTAFN